MNSLRVVVAVIIAGLIAVAAVADREVVRQAASESSPVRPALTVSSSGAATWYCPGGSGENGIAQASIRLINNSDEVRTAVVTALPGGDIVEDGEVTERKLEPKEETIVFLHELAPRAQWISAVVEVDGNDVVVEQRVVGQNGQRDQAPCATRTGQQFVAPAGATRLLAEGEQVVLLVSNPFPDDAVVGVEFSSDVGSQSLDGLVVPAQSVKAINVTEEVAVAESVSSIITAVSGRVSVARLQLVDSEERRALMLTPAAIVGSPVWVLPSVERSEGRFDQVAVTNPSLTTTVKVDLELVATDERAALEPVELDIRPGRTVVVDLSVEERLADIGAVSIIARSLDGLPIAVEVDSIIPGRETVSGGAATTGADAAATDWNIWIEPEATEESALIVVNPSSAAIVEVTVGESAPVELGPRRRLTVPVSAIQSPFEVVSVSATGPVVVGRELNEIGSRSMAVGVAVRGTVTPLADID